MHRLDFAVLRAVCGAEQYGNMKQCVTGAYFKQICIPGLRILEDRIIIHIHTHIQTDLFRWLNCQIHYLGGTSERGKVLLSIAFNIDRDALFIRITGQTTSDSKYPGG